MRISTHTHHSPGLAFSVIADPGNTSDNLILAAAVWISLCRSFVLVAFLVLQRYFVPLFTDAILK